MCLLTWHRCAAHGLVRETKPCLSLTHLCYDSAPGESLVPEKRQRAKLPANLIHIILFGHHDLFRNGSALFNLRRKEAREEEGAWAHEDGHCLSSSLLGRRTLPSERILPVVCALSGNSHLTPRDGRQP